MTSHGKLPPASVTSQHRKRHHVAVAQLILIMTVYAISFIAVVLLVNGFSVSRLVGYVYFINHVSNFFIYLAVNSEFRKQVKQLLERMMTARREETVTVSSIIVC